jgi:hypothetical protein
MRPLPTGGDQMPTNDDMATPPSRFGGVDHFVVVVKK